MLGSLLVLQQIQNAIFQGGGASMQVVIRGLYEWRNTVFEPHVSSCHINLWERIKKATSTTNDEMGVE